MQIAYDPALSPTQAALQALERASVDQGNKGFDVASGLLQMVSLERCLAAGRG